MGSNDLQFRMGVNHGIHGVWDTMIVICGGINKLEAVALASGNSPFMFVTCKCNPPQFAYLEGVGKS